MFFVTAYELSLFSPLIDSNVFKTPVYGRNLIILMKKLETSAQNSVAELTLHVKTL